ncbi:hypothetical protein [Nocardia paucivorans]|uniref:hypothetical protein n=1 Tax=Nocardia paucivorans TaxID=114259 RepID=UPI0002F40465|nr:hypothetical protein [Nocardia paucivorans]
MNELHDQTPQAALLDHRRMPSRIPGLTGEQAREWREFWRWAAAAEIAELPGGGFPASAVLAYLEEVGGTLATRRGRVTAINEAHRCERTPVPGEAEAIRRALNPDRGARLDASRARADALLPQLPVTGWPEGLRGRRDAVIVLLGTSGLRWAQIAALIQRDIRVTDTAVTVGAQPLVELPATGDPQTCPVTVFRRWHAVLAHAPDPRGHLIAERILTDTDHGPEPELLEHFADQPYLTDFDARGIAAGYIGELDPLPAETIAAITLGLVLPEPARAAVGVLDSDYYERGVAARHRDQRILDELDDILDRIDAWEVPAILDFPPG